MTAAILAATLTTLTAWSTSRLFRHLEAGTWAAEGVRRG